MNGFDLVKKEAKQNVIAIIEDDQFKDLSANVKSEAVEFVDKGSVDGLGILRHSSSHLLACALQRIYHDVQFVIGPSIENGFYYDIDLDVKLSECDFVKIEEEMKKIVDEDIKFSCVEVSRKEALDLFKNNPYKLELINDIADDAPISVYYLGDFYDLCRGPHVPSTRYLKYFKLTKIAGAYWKGDAKNKQLQRIYGTAWDTKENLDSWFAFLEEADRRDHKKIGKAMDLFHFDPEFAPGAPFYHPKGWFIFRTLVEFLRDIKLANGYVEVATPTVMNRSLWETSGHWDKYGEHNYSGVMEDQTQFCVKPMNCPGGVLIYKNSPKSYRDLPLRMAEFGRVNRYEASGSLNGLLRVREFTQDDAHLFCTFEQAESEIATAIKLFNKIYGVLGFNESHIEIALSTRPEKRIGSDEIWDKSEAFLENSLKRFGLKYKIQPGEGAFYGPKLEFGFKDAIKRSWQIGTIQLDMNLPERFNMEYVGADGQKHRPVMIHLACFGSIERFLGMYIEHTEGKLPLWINPLQVVILNVNDKIIDYCKEIEQLMIAAKIRVELDASNNNINAKIREHSLTRVPYIVVVGENEKESKSVSIRIFGTDKQVSMSVSEFISKVTDKVNNKVIGFDL